MSSRSPMSGAKRSTPTSARRRPSACSRAGAPRWAGCPKAARPPWAPTTVPGSEESTTMKLSLGPVLFYWTREKLLNFYAEMAEQPLDVIYLGETACSKRRALSLDAWLGLARDLRGLTSAELVISGLTLVEAASELSSLRRLCDNGELLVEANDMGAVQFMRERGRPFVAGPALNIYNGRALAEL